jgi:hypothetical protein
VSPEPEEEPEVPPTVSRPSLFGISRQAAALLLSKKNGGLSRQREHPATYHATMRVLARDLKVGVTNANMQLQLERAIEPQYLSLKAFLHLSAVARARAWKRCTT